MESQNEINTLKSEHLTNGEKPIIACVEGLEDVPLVREDGAPETVAELIARMKESGNFEYDGKTGTQGIGYLITPLSPEGKLSEGFIMCTGVIGVGKDKATGKNVSFLSHQYPGAFLSKDSSRIEFRRDIKKRLEELREATIPNSADIVIVGGEYYKKSAEFEKEYEDSIEVLKRAVVEKFGFEPVVITGPKLPQVGFLAIECEESVFFDTENRRLYISRPKTGDSTTESFMPKDISSQKEKWENEQ